MTESIRALVVKNGFLADFREYARPETVRQFLDGIGELQGYEVRWICPVTQRLYQDSALSFLARFEMGAWEGLGKNCT